VVAIQGESYRARGGKVDVVRVEVIPEIICGI
jgi:hypothetical protein